MDRAYMKKWFLAPLLFLAPSISMAFQSAVNVVVKDGTLQAGTTTGFNVSSGTSVSFNSTNAKIQNLTAGSISSTGPYTSGSLSVSSMTASTWFQSSNDTIIGPAIITGATVAATVGGSLPTGTTIYWKVFSFSKNGSSRSQSALLPFIPGGANTAATISWNPVPGADHYGILRSSASAPGAGFVVITTLTVTSFVDNGVAAPSGNMWPSNHPYGSTGPFVSGGLLMDGNSTIVWNDYFSGTPLAYIGPTSAGEWVIKGGLGSNKNNIYFANSLDQNYWRFQQDPNDSSSALDAVIPGSNSDNHMKVIAGSSITFIVDNFNVADMSSQALNIHTLRPGTGGLGLFNASTDAVATIYNGGASGQREVGFRVTAGTAAYFSDQGNFDLYVAAANTIPATSSSVVQGRTGAVFISTPAYIHGSVSQTQAQQFYNGEIVTASSSTLTNTGIQSVWTDISTITLTQGHWRLTGSADISQNGATCSQYAVAISSFSGNTTTDHTAEINLWNDTCRGGSTEWNYNTAPWDVEINSSVRFFLKTEVNFSAGQPQKAGSIRAIRTD